MPNFKQATKVAHDVLRMPVKQAEAYITSAGCVYQTVCEDGEGRFTPMDIRNDRINLTLVNGIVTEASVG